MLPTPSKTESSGKTTPWTTRPAAENQCPVAAVRRRGRVPGAAPTPPRQDLVDRVRLEIANGTYETQAKIEALLPELVRRLQLAARLVIDGGEGKEGEEEHAHRRNVLGC